MEYVALRTVLIFLPLLAAGVFALFTDTVDQAAWIWGGAAVLAMLGYSLPRVYLHFRGKARMHKIERGLPIAIDMLTLCLTGGLNVLNSLQRVVKELHLAYPILAYELEIVRQQAELRSLEFALTQFADRVGLPHLRNLLVILSQSENLGTDAVSTLREYADDMRINMRQRADELANKAPFKLLFPAYLLAFGAGILLISPTVLEFTAFRRQNMVGETIHQARQSLQEPTAPMNNPEIGR
jgi:tight adherence protein C